MIFPRQSICVATSSNLKDPRDLKPLGHKSTPLPARSRWKFLFRQNFSKRNLPIKIQQAIFLGIFSFSGTRQIINSPRAHPRTQEQLRSSDHTSAIFEHTFEGLSKDFFSNTGRRKGEISWDQKMGAVFQTPSVVLGFYVIVTGSVSSVISNNNWAWWHKEIDSIIIRLMVDQFRQWSQEYGTSDPGPTNTILAWSLFWRTMA